MSNSRSRLMPSLLATALAVALASCGGGSSDAGGAASTTTNPPTAKTTTTIESTTTTVPEADQATQDEAASRIFREADFPEGWTVAVKAVPYATKGIKVDDCISPEGGPLSGLPLGAAAGGPTMRAPDADYFITSWAATFEDEAQATAFAEQVQTPEHAACMADTLEAGGKDRKDFSVAVTSAPNAERGVGEDHRVASDSYELREGDQVTSIVYIDTFQLGRTVVTVNSELGPMTQEQSDVASAVEAGLRSQRFA